MNDSIRGSSSETKSILSLENEIGEVPGVVDEIQGKFAKVIAGVKGADDLPVLLHDYRACSGAWHSVRNWMEGVSAAFDDKTFDSWSNLGPACHD